MGSQVGKQRKNQAVKRCLGTAETLHLFFITKRDYMSKKENDLKTLIETAKLYQENLADKNLLVIYQDRSTKKYLYVEFVFYKSNFLHLTGVNFKDSTDENMKSVLFFNKCINNELSLNDFTYRSDGTTRMKLDILREIVSINKTATMIGDYNQSRPTLITDKISGSVSACMGAVLNEKNYYVANTALKEDLRNVVSEWHPIKAIYVKNIDEKKYNIANYTRYAKDFDYNLVESVVAILMDTDE